VSFDGIEYPLPRVGNCLRDRTALKLTTVVRTRDAFARSNTGSQQARTVTQTRIVGARGGSFAAAVLPFFEAVEQKRADRIPRNGSAGAKEICFPFHDDRTHYGRPADVRARPAGGVPVALCVCPEYDSTSHGRRMPFPDTSPPAPPKNGHRARFFAVVGPSGRRLTCAAFDVETGLEVRLFYRDEHVQRSQHSASGRARNRRQRRRINGVLHWSRRICRRRNVTARRTAEINEAIATLVRHTGDSHINHVSFHPQNRNTPLGCQPPGMKWSNAACYTKGGSRLAMPEPTTNYNQRAGGLVSKECRQRLKPFTDEIARGTSVGTFAMDHRSDDRRNLVR
jgi:hypothetical protein